MTAPPIKVDIVEGQNTAVPALQRTGTEIARVAAGASGGLSPMQKLGKALVLSESREGSLALRSVRTAIDELGASASGLDPRLGRLVAVFGQLGIGGATGLAAVGGLAAIGVEVKTLIGLSDQLDERLQKENRSFADLAGGTAKAYSSLADLRKRMDDLTEPGIAEKLFAGLSERTGLGDVGTALRTTRTAQQTTARLEADLDLQRVHKEHAAVVTVAAQKQNALTLEILKGEEAVTKLRLGLHPTHEQLAALESVSRASAIALSNLDGPHKTRLLLLEGERSRIERLNAVILDRQARDDQRRRDEASFPTERVGADLYHRAALGQAGNIPTPGLTEAGTTPLENTVRAVQGSGTLAMFTPSPSDTKEKHAELGKDIGKGVSAFLAVAGGVSRGDAGSALAGIGGATSSLSSIKALSSLEPIGTILSGLGGIFSLFSHATPHVIIDGYDSRALTQQQQLLVALTGFKGLQVAVLSAGQDPRQIAALLGRQSRTDSTSRWVPGSS